MSSFSDRSPTWGAPERVHDPVAAFLLGELVAQLGSNLVIGLANVAVSGGEAFQVGGRLNIPYDEVGHVSFNKLPIQRSTHTGWKYPKYDADRAMAILSCLHTLRSRGL